MADPVLYWSAAFADAFVVALNEDPAFQKAARKFSETVIFRAWDTPGGEDVTTTYRIDGGRVTLVERRAEPAPSTGLRGLAFDKHAAFARTSAPYRIWVKLDKGEMNVVQALVSPEYVIDGPKLKITLNIGVFNAMSATIARMAKRYA